MDLLASPEFIATLWTSSPDRGRYCIVVAQHPAFQASKRAYSCLVSPRAARVTTT